MNRHNFPGSQSNKEQHVSTAHLVQRQCPNGMHPLSNISSETTPKHAWSGHLLSLAEKAHEVTLKDVSNVQRECLRCEIITRQRDMTSPPAGIEASDPEELSGFVLALTQQ